MASSPIHSLARNDQLVEHKALYEQANQHYGLAMAEGDLNALERAHKLAFEAQALRPNYIPGLNLLARIELQRQHFANAEFWVEQGLRYKPDSASLLYSAGHIALVQGKLNIAEQYFAQSAVISRVATKAVHSLAHVKLLQGEYVEAFRHYRELIKTNAHDVQIRSKLFETCAHIVADFYAEELEDDLLRYFDFTDVDHSQLRPLATSLLQHKLRLSDAGCPLDLETLAQDPLLLKCLARFYFTDPIFERLFVTLRQSILASSSATLSIRSDLLPLVSALAQQCWLNESVWYISDNEQALVNQLEALCSKMLKLDSTQSSDILPIMALVLMYQPLQKSAFYSDLLARSLQFPALLNDFVQAQIQETLDLKAFAQLLPNFGNSDDDVSQRVKAQYDLNPYPRWTSIGYNQPADYASSLKQSFPRFKAELPHNYQALDVLVAGCGTGRHAIRLSKYFPALNVTAIDLSTGALAYACHKANYYGLQDMQFLQGNILKIAALNRTFDVIECSGVLHHMEQPSAGLQALADQLNPGGIIKIALYSKTARQRISELRNLLGNDIPATDSNMRLVREALLQKSLPGDWNDLYLSADFYSLSACRDLIFHQQEHVFDVLDLPAFLATAGLDWMGMLAPEGSSALLALTGKQASELSVQEWHQLEQSNPDLFAGMYQFYAIKRG